MLSATSKVFLREIGRGHLHEVHSIDYADKAIPLSLVIKKKRWYWIHPSFDPTTFNVKSIIAADSKMADLGTSQVCELPDFQSSMTFSVKGEIGAELAKITQLSLSGSDSITLDAPLGKIMRKSVDLEALIDELNKQKVDLNNFLIAECLNSNWRKTLGLSVVIESFFIANDAVLTAKVDWSASAAAKANVAPVHADVKVDDDKQFKFTLAAGSVIAFRTLDLIIDTTTGRINCKPDVFGNKGCSGFCCTKSDKLDAEEDCWTALLARIFGSAII